MLFVTLIAFCLTCFPQRKWTIELVGFLVGLIFFFRQITGVFVAMGVLMYLLTEAKAEGAGRDTLLARGLLGLILAGTVIYLISATNASGLLLIGIWPVALLIQAILTARTTNKRSLEIGVKITSGFVAASLPILIYHIVHDSLRTFFDDTVLRALGIQQLAYLKLASYAGQQAIALRSLLAFRNFHEVVNGVFWFLLPLTVLVTGALTVKRLGRYRSSGEVGALPILAVFYALVALFQQIPIYLFYVLPLTVAGLFWLSLQARRRTVLLLASIAILFSAIGIYYHAGQPLTRLLTGMLRGERVALVPATSLDRVGLWVDPGSLGIYTDIVDTIQANSQPNETLFVLPYNAELYFLAERRNPFRFWNTAVGIRPGREEQRVFDLLKSSPPRVVVMAPRDRNNTPTSQKIIAYVRQNYDSLKTIGDFEVYRAR